MNVFSGLQVYGGSWKVVADKTRGFSEEELALISKAEVVPSEYGNSVCFFMKSGGQSYIPLSRDASLTVGDSVDLSKAQILTLHRDGNEDIIRISI